MASQSFRQITRTFRWLHLVLFVGLPLAAVLTVALALGTQRIVDQAKEKIELDFFALSTYLHTQTRYLQNLQQRNQELPQAPTSLPANIGTTTQITGNRPYLYQVRPSLADIPYAILCTDQQDCPARHDAVSTAGGNLHAIGDFLSDFYSAFWARSYFPGATTLLVDLNHDISLIVPADSGTLSKELLSPQNLMQSTQAIRQAARNAGPDGDTSVRWMRAENLSCCLIGIADAMMAYGTWPVGPDDRTPHIVMATILDLSHADLFARISAAPQHDGFWLQHGGAAPLIGHGAPPALPGNGIDLTASGVVYAFTDKTGRWSGIYKVRYGTLFRANPWLPLTALALLALCLAGGGFYARWYNRRVVLPIQQSHLALKESEAFSRTLLNTAPVALCVLARDTGQVLFANALAHQWLDIPAVPEGQSQALPTGLLPPDVLQADTLGTREGLRHAERTLQAAYAPTRYRDQAALLCAFVDLSVRAQYETALQHAKAEADSANAAKTRFLAAMSHEIRTPLYGILGTMELLSMSTLTPAQRQQVQRLQQSSAILMQLISDILDLTKIEADQMSLAQAPFCPRQLIQQCIDGFSDTAHGKGLHLFACIDPDVPDRVIGDALRIRQVLTNFLSNAIKFTASGQVVARLRASLQDNGNAALTFQVVDSGMGISAEDQKQLFAPFYQVASASRFPQGTGLGLSISDNLARLMGGSIQVTSELGLGSSFALRLTLPVDAQAQPADHPDLHGFDLQIHSPHAELSQNLAHWFRKWGADARAILPAQSPEADIATDGTILLDVLPVQSLRQPTWPGRYMVAGPAGAAALAHAEARIEGYGIDAIASGLLGRLPTRQRDADSASGWTHDDPLGLNVLVAEDNPINQATLKEQLERLGCAVTMTADGADALRRWSGDRYDVVLTDLNMPRMNGYELTEALRQAGATVPIIGVTANAMRQEEDDCRRIGMTDWIVKPIDLDTLHRHLADIASRRGMPDSAGAPPRAPAAAASPSEDAGDAARELDRIPERHRDLFRQSLLADAAALIDAVDSDQASRIGQALHRMHGALLAMRQQTLSQRIQAAQDALRSNDPDPALRADILRIATDLQHLIETHMPT